MFAVDIFNAGPSLASLSNFATGYGFWALDDVAACRGSPPLRLWWLSAEHFFQAGKFADSELRDQVRRAETPERAKHLGRSLGPMRADWEEVKRERIQLAMTHKLRSHSQPREALLAIPEGTPILNGNPVDPYFGIGPDGQGANVIGLVLEELRAFLTVFPCRRQLLVKVADCGEPYEPQSLFVDAAGLDSAALERVLAEMLQLPPDAVECVELITEDGFERTRTDTIGDAHALEAFLQKCGGDCALEVRLTNSAPVTLWSGTDDIFMARTEVRHLCPDAPALRRRLQALMPLTRYESFARETTFCIDDGPPQAFSDAQFEQLAEAAAAGADVVVSSNYAVPAALQPPLLKPLEGELGPATVDFSQHTPLSKEALVDRVCGLVWGAALGDAVGLSTEFMKKSEAAEQYPDRSKLSPNLRVADRHRSRWPHGDWTDDTDQLVLVMDAVVAGDGVFDQRRFAQALKQWRQAGFPELGDASGLGVGETVNGVLEHPAYDVAPDVVAEALWLQSGKTMAANGAVMRCAACALGRFWDDEVVAYNAAASAAVTHADPRCAASCVAVALIAARAFAGRNLADAEARRQEVDSIVFTASRYLDGADVDELERAMNVDADGLASLELGAGGIGYTYKPLAAASWAFVHATNFRDAIAAIVMEAGDADSNATVAGALLGARFGLSALPQEWLDQVPPPQRAWLEARIDTCLRMLGL